MANEEDYKKLNDELFVLASIKNQPVTFLKLDIKTGITHRWQGDNLTMINVSGTVKQVAYKIGKKYSFYIMKNK